MVAQDKKKPKTLAPAGLEPATSALLARRSNQLSYRAIRTNLLSVHRYDFILARTTTGQEVTMFVVCRLLFVLFRVGSSIDMGRYVL